MRSVIFATVAVVLLAGCQAAPPEDVTTRPAPGVAGPEGSREPTLTMGVPRARIAVAEVDGVVYTFGGTDDRTSFDWVEALDTRDLTIRKLDARLPTPRDSMSAVAHAGVIYAFGGVSGARGTAAERFHDDIFRFDPAAQTLERLAAKLPTARANMGAFTDGARIYLVGGDGIVGGRVDLIGDIVVFDPATGTVELAPVKLPYPRNTPAAAWDGSAALILGGNVDAYRNVRDIVEYTPGSGIATLEAHLPVGSAGGAAVWIPSRGCAALVGAHDGRAPIQTPFCIFAAPAGAQVRTLDPLPTEPRYHPGVALVDGYVYLFGGFNAEREALAEIAVFQI